MMVMVRMMMIIMIELCNESVRLRKYYERDAAYLALIDSFIQVLIISWILLHLEKSFPDFLT